MTSSTPPTSLFPSITHLNQVLEAIKDVKHQFSIVNDNGFTFIKYKDTNITQRYSFPEYSAAKSEQELEHFKIRRECRGLVFRQSDGKLVVRRFHKFFNLSERVDTNIENIDFNREFYCLEKMDGSLVSPVLVRDRIRFTTMMGFTQQGTMVDQFVKYLSGTDQFQYDAFCRYCITNGMTPCFEFISQMNRIVINYGRNDLILLSVRNNETGEYCSREQICSWAKQYNIPVVKQWTDNDIPKGNGEQLVQYIRRKTGVEGCVIVFPETGDIYKCKTIAYSIAHGLHPERLKERSIWKAAIENVIDDLVSLIDFDVRIRDCLQRFRDEMQTRLATKGNALCILVKDILKQTSEEERNSMLKKLSKHDQIVVTKLIQQSNIQQLNIEDQVSNHMKEHLLRYMDNAKRFWNEDRDSIYEWISLSLECIHPFGFERSTGSLMISQRVLKSLSSEEYKHYHELHTKMMSPKGKSIKCKPSSISEFTKSLHGSDNEEDILDEGYIRIIKTPNTKQNKKNKKKKKRK
jgi:T4 RnlA family RNA ligase